MAISSSVLSPLPSIVMPARSVTVLMLRHGQSEWNAARRWQGLADSPLTDLGRSQATQTALRLRDLDVRFAGPWTSDLRRAAETADIIASALGLEPARPDPRLREADAGEWQGRTPWEIEREFPGWLDAHRRPATFEPYEQVVARATASIVDIAAQAANGAPAGLIALVVAHSGVIRSLVRHLGVVDERIPNLGGVWFEVGNTSTTVGRAGRAPVELRGMFDPAGIVISGVDAPGEDPGDQADDPEDQRSPDR
jgi:broad specificity phosphatase PhoE